MVVILDDIQKYFKVKDIDEDNAVFKLFYKISFGLCVLGAILVATSEYVGKPINCQTPEDASLSNDLYEAHCWIHGAYHIPYKFREDFVKKYANDRGFGCMTNQDDADDEQKDTAYYQWVAFMLVINAIIFIIPHQLWKLHEGGLMKAFSKEVYKKSHVEAQTDSGPNTGKLAKDFANYFLTLKEEGHLGRNMRYFIVFFICECLNFVALYFNCHITYKFLGGTAKHSFWTYGSDVLEYWGSGEFQSKKRNPMCDMFPTTVSCSISKSAVTGGVEEINGMCILSQNIINEKIYLALWFWFMILFVIVGLQLVLRLATIAIPALRKTLLLSRLKRNKNVDCFLMECNVGDWFILTQISKNVDPFFYDKFMGEILSKWRTNQPNGSLEMQGLMVKEDV